MRKKGALFLFLQKIRNKISILFIKFRSFVERNLKTSTTVLLLSFLTGVFGATVAIIIKNLLHLNVSLLANLFPPGKFNYLHIAFPLIGILLTQLYIRFFVKDDINHGVTIALKAMSKSGGKLRRHNTYSSMIASSITVGFGGSVGLEAPIVLTGSAIGSNLATAFNLSRKNTLLLLACGTTAAIAAVFKSPIAGIVFAIEVLMLDLTTAALLPLLISAATGTVLSILFLGENVMFGECLTVPFSLKNIPFYILLGLLTGVVSIYFLRTLWFIEKLFAKIKRQGWRIIIGGLLLGVLILFFPVFYGEGYENLNQLLHGQGHLLFENSPIYPFFRNYHILFILFIVGVILLKVVATAVTTGAGGIGGAFAPSLFAGAFTGFLLAEILNHYFFLDLPYINYILAGMAGVMAGVMHAPLTAIFLIVEVSVGYSLLIPLMITASISYLVVHPFEKHSIYTKKLAEKGELRTHNKDQFAMRQLNIMQLIDTDVLTIPIHSTLRDYTSYIAKSRRNLFVVLDENEKFAGLLVMDYHREILFKQELYDKVKIEELMIQPDVFVYDTDKGKEIVEKFQKTNNYNLPVITKEKKYIGFLSKANVLAAYKRVVASESED